MVATPIYDSSRTAREAPRKSAYDGAPPKYSMAVCPHCHRYCAQLRGDWSRLDGQWLETLTCQLCRHKYTRSLLPIEVERTRRGQRRA